jgi:oligopeptide/dipeptide ABC transporter ATP-binding protein
MTMERELARAGSMAATGFTSEGVKGALLEVNGLKTYFDTDRGVARAVDSVGFQIAVGETLGLVGESGCGKSVTALSILRLVATPPGRIVEGSIRLEGRELLGLSENEIRRVRGNEISMIFQEPMTSLNPVLTIGDQLMEPLLLHRQMNRAGARREAVEMLGRVKIPSADTLMSQYPHQISGGMRQRVMIAMALVCRPKLLIADEPTTALDVTIQAQILDLLEELQQEMKMAILMITHDLGVVASLASRVAVMYAGRIVEMAGTRDLFERPRHPYTLGLFESRPRLRARRERLEVIAGAVPNPTSFPEGCRFHPRCKFVATQCRTEDVSLAEPELVGVRAGAAHETQCLRVQRGEIDLTGAGER